MFNYILNWALSTFEIMNQFDEIVRNIQLFSQVWNETVSINCKRYVLNPVLLSPLAGPQILFFWSKQPISYAMYKEGEGECNT